MLRCCLGAYGCPNHAWMPSLGAGLMRLSQAGGGKQVLRPPPLKIASTAEHVRRVVTRAREGHGGRKADTKDVDETGEARSTAPRARRRGGR